MLETAQRSGPALVRANGVDLCYDTFGDRAAPPMLLIMGFGAQLIQWDDEFCAGLAQRGFWVVRFDNRDVGLSTKMPARAAPRRLHFTLARALGRLFPVPYRLSDMASDVVGLLTTRSGSAQLTSSASRWGA